VTRNQECSGGGVRGIGGFQKNYTDLPRARIRQASQKGCQRAPRDAKPPEANKGLTAAAVSEQSKIISNG
jgi:hypothetical protein